MAAKATARCQTLKPERYFMTKFLVSLPYSRNGTTHEFAFKSLRMVISRMWRLLTGAGRWWSSRLDNNRHHEVALGQPADTQFVRYCKKARYSPSMLTFSVYVSLLGEWGADMNWGVRMGDRGRSTTSTKQQPFKPCLGENVFHTVGEMLWWWNRLYLRLQSVRKRTGEFSNLLCMNFDRPMASVEHHVYTGYLMMETTTSVKRGISFILLINKDIQLGEEKKRRGITTSYRIYE